MNLISPDKRFDIRPALDNHFAWLRTRLSIEQTFLSWIRTSVSLIGFGFTIVQFFQRLRDITPMNGRQMRAETPRDLGLALIGTGIGVLLISGWQYWNELRYLWSEPFKEIAGFTEKPHRTPAMFAAAVLMVIGVAAFVSVFFRFF